VILCVTSPVHNSNQLLPDILCSSHGSGLQEVLEAPRVGELGVLPSLVDGEQSDVVSVRVIELGLLQVRLGSLLFGPVEGILHR